MNSDDLIVTPQPFGQHADKGLGLRADFANCDQQVNCVRPLLHAEVRAQGTVWRTAAFPLCRTANARTLPASRRAHLAVERASIPRHIPLA